MRVHRRVWTDEFRWLQDCYWGTVERIVGGYNATGTIAISLPLAWLRLEKER